MRYRDMLGILTVIIALAISPLAAAQTNSSESAILLAPVAPSTQVTNMTLQVPVPSTWEFIKRRFWHFFTFDRYQRLNQETDLASMTLLAARQAQLAGNVDRAQVLLQNFDTSMTQSSTRVAELAGQAKELSDEERSQQLLASTIRARIFQAALAEQMSAVGDANGARRALEIRLVTLSELTRFLALGKATDATYSSRVRSAVDLLAKNEPGQTETAVSLAKISLLEEIAGRLLETDPRLALVQQIEVAELDSIARSGSDKVQLATEKFNQSYLNHESLVKSLLSRVPVAESSVADSADEPQAESVVPVQPTSVAPKAPVITPQVEEQVEQLKVKQIELEKDDQHEIDD